VGGRRRWVTSATSGGDDGDGGDDDDDDGAGTETIDVDDDDDTDAGDGEERLRPAASSRATGGGERRRARVWCVTRRARARRREGRVLGDFVRVRFAIRAGWRARGTRGEGWGCATAAAAAIGVCKPLSADGDDDGRRGVGARGCVRPWRLRLWCVGDDSDAACARGAVVRVRGG
jgi:hypothetical protein